MYDAETESRFADQLEKNIAVKPGWFIVPTPLGSYHPDWAFLIDSDAGERLYLVDETKGSRMAGDLRAVERAKVACGKAQFRALEVGESPAR